MTFMTPLYAHTMFPLGHYLSVSQLMGKLIREINKKKYFDTILGI